MGLKKGASNDRLYRKKALSCAWCDLEHTFYKVFVQVICDGQTFSHYFGLLPNNPLLGVLSPDNIIVEIDVGKFPHDFFRIIQ